MVVPTIPDWIILIRRTAGVSPAYDAAIHWDLVNQARARRLALAELLLLPSQARAEITAGAVDQMMDLAREVA